MIRKAFTIVELLVVIVVIAVLAALLLTAVQAARGTARRLTCVNHFKQLALSVHIYAERNREFIPARVRAAFNAKGLPVNGELGPNNWLSIESMSWRVTLLPYHERQALHDRIDFHKSALSETNLAVARTALVVHQCPETPNSPRALVDMGWGGVWRFGVRTAACDDVALAGVNITSTHPGSVFLEGAWSVDLSRSRDTYDEYRQAASVRDVVDGLSHTILIGERAGWPEWYEHGGVLAAQQYEYPAQGAWMTVDGIDWVQSIVQVNEANNQGLFSFHFGGAHSAMCDGSVHFINERVAKDVLTALISRAGGEPVDPKDWAR